MSSRRLLVYLDAVGLAHASASSALSEDAAQRLSETDTAEVLAVSAHHYRPRYRRTPRFWRYDDDEDYWPDELRWWDWVGPAELSTPEAAAAFRVTPATVRQWVRRGHLAPLRRQGRTLIFDARAVYRASIATDERNRQPGGTAPRTGRRKGIAAAGIPGSLMRAQATAAQAAHLVGVSEATVRTWAHRGHLAPASKSGRTAYYLVADVVAVARRSAYRPPRKIKPPM